MTRELYTTPHAFLSGTIAAPLHMLLYSAKTRYTSLLPTDPSTRPLRFCKDGEYHHLQDGNWVMKRDLGMMRTVYLG